MSIASAVAEVEWIYCWAWSSIFSGKLIHWSCEIHQRTSKCVYKKGCGRNNFQLCECSLQNNAANRILTAWGGNY